MNRTRATCRFEDAEPAEQARREQEWIETVRIAGNRYAECRALNFEFHGTSVEQKRQRAAVEQIVGLCGRVAESVGAGENMILFGPPGTGKDHLLFAALREACSVGLSVYWTTGVEMFAEVRDRMDRPNCSEIAHVSGYTDPDVLAISDPVPPWGDLTGYQGAFLYRVLDERYRHCRSTWITGNFEDGNDAARRMGAQVVDRLRHGGLAICCNWPSYRKGITNGDANDQQRRGRARGGA